MMPADLGFPVSDSNVTRTAAAAGSLTVALWCASRGWPVHPLSPGRKTPVGNCAECRAPGHSHHKCPCLTAGRWCHGFRCATLDKERLTNWWSHTPHFGIGIACGPAGLVVIDIDAHSAKLPGRDRILPGIPIGPEVTLTGMENGFHTLGVLAALRGQLSPAHDTNTLRVRTPSGGCHVWYTSPGPRRWRCSTGSSQGAALAWQVDVRAHGGYIVAPGTWTPNGTYTPLPGAREPAPLPSWLANELHRTGHAHTTPNSRPATAPPRAREAVLAAGGTPSGPGHRLLASLLADVTACATTPQGAGFSDKLNRAAYTAGGLVAAGRILQTEAETALKQAAQHARPGQESRSQSIIQSGMAAGSRQPLHPGSRP